MSACVCGDTHRVAVVVRHMPCMEVFIYINDHIAGKFRALGQDNEHFSPREPRKFNLPSIYGRHYINVPPSGGSLVRREVAHNLLRLIAEGTDDEDTDAELRLDAVSSYLDLLEKQQLPDILVKIICWVS